MQSDFTSKNSLFIHGSTDFDATIQLNSDFSKGELRTPGCLRPHWSRQLFPPRISTEGTLARKNCAKKGSSTGNTIILGVKHSQWNNDEPSAATLTAFMRGWVTLRGALTDSCEKVGPRERGGQPSLPSTSVRCWPGRWKMRQKRETFLH